MLYQGEGLAESLISNRLTLGKRTRPVLWSNFAKRVSNIPKCFSLLFLICFSHLTGQLHHSCTEKHLLRLLITFNPWSWVHKLDDHYCLSKKLGKFSWNIVWILFQSSKTNDILLINNKMSNFGLWHSSFSSICFSLGLFFGTFDVKFTQPFFLLSQYYNKSSQPFTAFSQGTMYVDSVYFILI